MVTRGVPHEMRGGHMIHERWSHDMMGHHMMHQVG